MIECGKIKMGGADLAERSRDFHGGKLSIANLNSEATGIVGLCDVEFFGREDTAGAGDVGHIGDVWAWEVLGRYKPFLGYSGSTVRELAVANGLPSCARH